MLQTTIDADVSNASRQTAPMSRKNDVTTPSRGGRQRADSQASVKSVTEDVWNTTVDSAFDSALSLYEPV
jgi:hypothetical protein